MKNVRKLVIAGLCVAIGLILPMAFHAIPNAGGVFLPMHIPVLLCGLVCGAWFGLGCGALLPVLSSVVTGMPPIAILPSMLCELAVYGLVSGLLGHVVKTKNSVANLYISLVGAMLSGRLVCGLLNALIFKAGAYSISIWTATAFVTALPGIAIQLVLIPLLVFAMNRAHVVSVECVRA